MSESALSQRLHRWLAGDAEAQVLRWLLRVLLIATVGVLAFDLSAMTGFRLDSLWREVTEQPVLPDMPPVTIEEPANPEPGRRVVPARKADGALAKPMTFALNKNGRLIATGMIAPGSAETFASEVNARGEYIKTVVLNSPGGSVADALEMGRLIRARGFATEVEPNRICVSSCPLIFVRRRQARRRRPFDHRRASGVCAGSGGGRAARYDERGAARLGALPALSRRYGRRSKDVGARDGDAEGPAVHFSSKRIARIEYRHADERRGECGRQREEALRQIEERSAVEQSAKLDAGRQATG